MIEAQLRDLRRMRAGARSARLEQLAPQRPVRGGKTGCRSRVGNDRFGADSVPWARPMSGGSGPESGRGRGVAGSGGDRAKARALATGALLAVSQRRG